MIFWPSSGKFSLALEVAEYQIERMAKFRVIGTPKPTQTEEGSAMKFGKVGSSGMVYYYTITRPFEGCFGPKTVETRIVVGNRKRTRKA
jgi:hypothetical protein